MSRGRFITLEGGEGAGKSTQAALLLEYLTSQGIHAICTREVGGTASAEEIRNLWLHKDKDHWDALTEVLLIMAARREHLVKKIWPALEAGTWVISDRYVDSTRVYQGVVMGLGLAKIDALYHEIAPDFWPDLTLFLDLPVEQGLARVAARQGQDDRYQQQDQDFHQHLRQGFVTLQRQEPRRIVTIDAAGHANETALFIQQAINPLIVTATR